jgi:hypothetical protein
MILSAWDFFDSGLKRAQSVVPHLFKVSTKAGNAFRIEPVDATCPVLCIKHETRILENAKVL